MEAKRKGDLITRVRFGSDRMFQHGDVWFFCTREGTLEGPFEGRLEANCQVKSYIEMMVSRLRG